MKLAMAAGLHLRCPVGSAVVIVAHRQHFASGGTKFQGLIRQSTLLTSPLGEGSCSAEPDPLGASTADSSLV
jgi:hypothetical protein